MATWIRFDADMVEVEVGVITTISFCERKVVALSHDLARELRDQLNEKLKEE